MKTNLVINPSDEFIKKSDEFTNLFVDRYVYDHCKIKRSTDQFISTRLDSNYRIKNFNLLNSLFYEIIECIKIELNSIFEKNYNQKFYEIVVGSWLRKFVQQFIFKYKNIIEIKNSSIIHSAKIYKSNNFNFFTSETHTIQDATNNNLWNSCIYSYILKNLDFNIELNIVDPPKTNFDDSNFLIFKDKRKSLYRKKDFKQNIVDLYSSMANFLPNNSNIFIYNSGFNLFDEQKINLMFGQIPRMYPIKHEFNYSNFNENLRKKFNFEKFLKVSNKHDNQDFAEIFNLVLRILHKSLPIFIIEDFNRLIEFSGKLNFPKKPKAICTSYAFESAEPFKFYLGIQKFLNPQMKYFVYQHGGSYITRLDNSFYNETNTCDYFITMGDKTDETKNNNIKFVNFRLRNKRYFKAKKLEKLLLLLRSSGYNAMPYDVYSERVNQVDLTINLLKKFSDDLKKNTIIRAHYSSINKMDHVIKHLNGFKIDYSEQNYFDAVNISKLLLFNYDSTGMLEMLALNKPILCMWEKGNQHLNNFVVDDYDLLRKAKILFDDTDELYKHLNKIWNDPFEWWYSDDVQKNINKFVKLYTKFPDNDFSNNFKNLIKKHINY